MKTAHMLRGIIGCALLTGLSASIGATTHAGSPAVGTAAPDFTATSFVTGAKTRLSEQRGKVVILTFWATWCAPCRAELPNLEGIQQHVGKDKLTVLAVSYRDSEETLRYLKKNAVAVGWLLTMLMDPNGSIADKYGIASIPRMFLIGRDGHIIAAHSGFGDGALEEMLPEINAALARSAAPLSPAAQ